MSLRQPLRLLADVPELLQHAEVISHAPALGDAVAFEAVDVDVIDRESLAGRSPLRYIGPRAVLRESRTGVDREEVQACYYAGLLLSQAWHSSRPWP